MTTAWRKRAIAEKVSKDIMNDPLNKLIVEAGAPKEVMDQLWFQIFCVKFADLLIKECEESNA